MKRLVWIALALILSFGTYGAAFAQQLPDVYIEEQLVGPSLSGGLPGTGVIKSWISGRKLKKEAPGGEEVFIFRADLNKVYVVNTTRKSYIEIPMSEMRMMTEKSLDMYIPKKNGVVQLPDELYVKTGKTKKIGAWKTYEVEVNSMQSGPGMESKTTMWVTKDLDFDHSFLIRIFKITMGDEVSPDLRKLFDKMTDLDGYPVQQITTTTFQNQTFTSTNTLLKIERKKIDDSVFVVPGDYTRIEPPKPAAVPTQ